MHRLYISQNYINLIIEHYKDFDRVCWKNFCDDIDEIFTADNQDKVLYIISESNPEDFQVLLRDGQEDWTCQPKDIRKIAEDAIYKIKNYIKSRSLYIEPFFKGYDRFVLL